MLISPELATAINEQIGREFGASLQYLSIAGHFHTQKLTLLAKFFFTAGGGGEDPRPEICALCSGHTGRTAHSSRC